MKQIAYPLFIVSPIWFLCSAVYISQDYSQGSTNWRVDWLDMECRRKMIILQIVISNEILISKLKQIFTNYYWYSAIRQTYSYFLDSSIPEYNH